MSHFYTKAYGILHKLAVKNIPCLTKTTAQCEKKCKIHNVAKFYFKDISYHRILKMEFKIMIT